MFNRKLILACVSCLHRAPKHKFPRLCPCTKTHISYSFWKLQAWNLEHKLLAPYGSHRNCILGARIHYAPILSIVRAWALQKKSEFQLVELWIFFYHIYCVTVSYIILTFIQTSKCFPSNGTNDMHILASGPEQQAVYFGHVIQTGSGEKRGLALRIKLCLFTSSPTWGKTQGSNLHFQVAYECISHYFWIIIVRFV